MRISEKVKYQRVRVARVRRVAYAALFILIAILMLVLILVSYTSAIRCLLVWWREEHLPSTIALGETLSNRASWS